MGLLGVYSPGNKKAGVSVWMIGDPEKAADVYAQGATSSGRLQKTALAAALPKQETPVLTKLPTEEDKP
ncbi:MAG TPA: hypothetical protein VHE99_11260 [Gammaproteobacteria bacterium]|nr:hypothetical protein [Gammaproteobacteria bacterium]